MTMTFEGYMPTLMPGLGLGALAVCVMLALFVIAACWLYDKTSPKPRVKKEQ